MSIVKRKLALGIAVGTAGLLLMKAVATALPGDLDPTFEADGMIRTQVGNGKSASAAEVVVQSDGKLVVGGGAERKKSVALDFALVRYHANGSVDKSFGKKGRVLTSIKNDASIAAVALQADGKIVAAGGAADQPSNSSIALARYLPDGSPDFSFSTDGIVTTDIGSWLDYALDVAIDQDGKIVVAGVSWSNLLNPQFDILVARYNTNGTLDTSFNGDGIAIVPVLAGNDYAHAVAIQADNKIVVGGSAENGSHPDAALLRFTTSGDLDPTFGGGDGIVTTPFALGTAFSDIKIRTVGAQEQIVGGGFVVIDRQSGPDEDFFLAAYDTTGTLLGGFGAGGITTAAIGARDDACNHISVQTDGKIVAAGYAEQQNASDFAVARFTSGGTRDTSFGFNGARTTHFKGVGARSSDDEAFGSAIQQNGAIVLVGRTGLGFRARRERDRFALARYQP